MGYVADEFTGRRLGRYELLCRMAVGGMAEIFLGFDTGATVQRPLAIKRILQENREDQTALQMLIDEARVTASLNHPNVAQVLDLAVTDDEVLLVIEFISGANLDELVQAAGARKELLPLGFVLTALFDLANGLQHAHGHRDAAGKATPVIHRDVTPRNLMVDFEGVGHVLDFGIARAAGAARRTVAGMVRGTTAYMSPEQVIDKSIDTRSDLFALGTVFHELLTGQRLFSTGNAGTEMAAVYEKPIALPSVVNKRVPKAIDPVVMRLLERNPDRRYQQASEFARDLARAGGGAAWEPRACADFVRERFAARRAELSRLLALIEEGAPQPTLPGRPAFRPSVPRQPAVPSSRVPIPTASPVGAKEPERELPTTSFRRPPSDDEDSDVATQVFGPAPTQPARPREARRADDEGMRASGPDDLDEPTTTARRSPRELEAEPLSASQTTLPQHVRPTSHRSAALLLGAALAIGVGAITGVVLSKVARPRSPEPPATATGRGGRLSLTSATMLEVALDGRAVGRTPLLELEVPAGALTLQVRPDAQAPWRTVEVLVATEGVTRFEIPP